VRAIAWGCLALGGCYLAPPAGVAAPSSTDPVGCITIQRTGRRSRRYWIGQQEVGRGDVEKALETVPASRDQAQRNRVTQKVALGLFFAGGALIVSSIGVMGAWATAKPDSTDPLYMMIPAISGYFAAVSGVVIGIAGDGHWRKALDAYNDAATRSGRCPP
jgi:hypothetical protein